MLSLDELLERGKEKIKIYKDFRLRADVEVIRKLTVCIPDMHLLEKGPTDDFFENKKEKARKGSNLV